MGTGPVRRDPVLILPHGCPLIGPCVKCGAVPANQRRLAKVQWAPPWIYATILISWIITVVAYYATRKQSYHDVSLCDPCAAQWDHSNTQQALALTGALGGLIGGTAFIASEMLAPGVAMLLGAPIIGIAGSIVASRKRLRARRIDDNGVQLLDVDPAVMPYGYLPPAQPAPTNVGGQGPGHPAPGYLTPTGADGSPPPAAGGHASEPGAPYTHNPHLGPHDRS